MQKILLIHGPNLNLMGPGSKLYPAALTLSQLEQKITALATSQEVQVECLQSNHEGVILDTLHAAASKGVTHIIINAGPLAAASIALRDALVGVDIPYVEVLTDTGLAYAPQDSLLAQHAQASFHESWKLGYSAAVAWALSHC